MKSSKLYIKTLVFSFLLIFNLQELFGYTPTETLYSRIKSETDSIKMVNLYNELGWNYLLRRPDSAKYFFCIALEIANKVNYKSGKTRALANLSAIFSQRGDYSTSGKYLNEARNIAFNSNDSVNLAIIYSSMASNYDLINLNDKSIEYYLKAYEINIKINKEYNMLSNLVSISLGFIYENRLDKVDYYLNRTHLLPVKYFYTPATLYYYILLSQRNFYNKDLSGSLKYLDSAMYIAEQTGNAIGKVECYNLYAKQFTASSNYSNALKFALLAEKNAKFIEFGSGLIHSYKNSALINDYLGKYSESSKYWKLYDKLKDSLYGESIMNKIQIINSQFEFDQTQSAIQKKDYEMNLQIEKVKNRDKSIFSLFAILIIALAFTYLLYKSFLKIKQNSIDLNNRNEEISQISATLALQNKDLEILNATKDKFFSIIGHDLRNPIGGIKNLTSLLISNEANLKDNEKNEIIVSIDKAAFNTYTLLENLLQWAKAQSGGLDFSQEIVYLNSIVKRSIELIKHSATQKNILIQVGKIDFTILGDHNMTETVIRNLLSNAIKFTPNGGKISISVAVPIQECKFVEIRVEDNGVGMSKTQIAGIFDLANHSTTRGTNNETGSGLGLLLCKEFVERMGGRIWVESEEGKGSKFIFTLPANNVIN